MNVWPEGTGAFTAVLDDEITGLVGPAVLSTGKLNLGDFVQAT